MARMRMNFQGDVGGYEIFLPEACAGERKRYPVLWLLHDYGVDATCWHKYSNLETLAREKNLVVICPRCESTFFLNVPCEPHGDDNLADELVGRGRTLMLRMLPVSREAKDHTIAGVGMGGYGAIHLMLEHPDKFGTAISLSGYLDAPNRYASGEYEHYNGRIFGPAESVTGGENDLYALIRKKPLDGQRLCIACQKGDEAAKAFFDAASSEGCNVEFHDGLPRNDLYSLDAYIEYVLRLL